jgi:hypothetical protein
MVRKAGRLGYAAAIVVNEFAKVTAYTTGGIKIVPCPQETGRSPSCIDCRLCWKDDLLRRAGITIGFEAHSNAADKIRSKLIQIAAMETVAVSC